MELEEDVEVESVVDDDDDVDVEEDVAVEVEEDVAVVWVVSGGVVMVVVTRPGHSVNVHACAETRTLSKRMAP